MALVAVGCGGDDTAVPLDSGKDQTASDSPPTETGADTQPDTKADAGPDGDSATPDGSDAGLPPLGQWPLYVTTLECQRLAECCFPGDAAAFDMARCISAGEANGLFVRGLTFHEGALAEDAGGHFTQYDVAKALACKQEARHYNCTMQSAEYLAIKNDCWGAISGTIALNGTGCTDSLHCANGRCVLAADGGPGTCSALAGDGGACSALNPAQTFVKGSDDCSYRGTDTSGLFCDDSDPDAAAWHCAPQFVGIGGGCNNESDYEGACQSGICAQIGGCATSIITNSIQGCGPFTKDGG